MDQRNNEFSNCLAEMKSKFYELEVITPLSVKKVLEKIKYKEKAKEYNLDIIIENVLDDQGNYENDDNMDCDDSTKDQTENNNNSNNNDINCLNSNNQFSSQSEPNLENRNNFKSSNKEDSICNEIANAIFDILTDESFSENDIENLLKELLNSFKRVKDYNNF